MGEDSPPEVSLHEISDTQPQDQQEQQKEGKASIPARCVWLYSHVHDIVSLGPCGVLHVR